MGISKAVERERERETEVVDQLDRLFKSICILKEQIGVLEDRLGKVLRGHGDIKSDDAPEEALVPLATDIRANRRNVEECSMVISSIFDRIEL